MGFGDLAQRISAWTSRLLVSLIVIVAGIGFGRQVLYWWSPAASAPRLDSQFPNEPSPFQPQLLRFGSQSWAIETLTLAGGKGEAIASLVASCRKAAEDPQAVAAVPDAGERALLESLSQRPPREEKPGKWRLYATNDVFPMALVASPAATGTLPQGDNLAQASLSVLTWGIAVPSGAQSWILYTFHPRPSANGSVSGLAGVPIPPGSRNTLTLQSPDGGAVAAFEGDGELAAWKRFYEQHFASSGWKRVGDWGGSQEAAHARFTVTLPGKADNTTLPGKADAATLPARSDTVDVRIGYGRSGRLTGLLSLIPATNEVPTREKP